MWLTSDFDYELPAEQIARHPLLERTHSRLLILENNNLSSIQEVRFDGIDAYLRPGDLLVLNNTKVIKARCYGFKATGGKIECLVERVISDHEFWAHIGASKSPKIGSRVFLGKTAVEATVTGRQDNGLFELNLLGTESIWTVLEREGEMPLPPYFDRHEEAEDHARYQTVFAEELGAVAAPTAGLHFDEPLLDRLSLQGVEIAYVTLHVGAGTFLPVRAEEIEGYQLHSERVVVPQETVNAIEACRLRGGRVIAVGTTVVRSLEAAARDGKLQSFEGETALFIYPGYQFRVIDGLITNFHLPKSSLLMLVCALGGYERIMHAYRFAIQENFRFYSYGDAMFIQK